MDRRTKTKRRLFEINGFSLQSEVDLRDELPYL